MTQPTREELPEILTAPEVARLTGYHHSTVCRWAKHGHLPYLRKLDGTGGYLFDRSVLELIAAK